MKNNHEGEVRSGVNDESEIADGESLSYEEMQVIGSKLSLFLGVLLCVMTLVTALSYYYSKPVRIHYETLREHEAQERDILETCLPYCEMESLRSLKSIKTPLVLSKAYLDAYNTSLRNVYHMLVTTHEPPQDGISLRTQSRGQPDAGEHPPGYGALLEEMRDFPDYASNVISISSILLAQAEENLQREMTTHDRLCAKSGIFSLQCRREKAEGQKELARISDEIKHQKQLLQSVGRYTSSTSVN